MRELWKQPKRNLGSQWREHLVEWRREPATTRVRRPTRIDRARSLGYKAKEGFIVVRQRVFRGGHTRPHDLGGRRSKHAHHRLVLNKSYQRICEERAQKRFPNLEVLGSYYLAKDGHHIWYEIIMIDRNSPVIKADKRISWITKPKHKGRANRGKTSAGRRGRGLHNKGKGAEKVRPSRK